MADSKKLPTKEDLEKLSPRARAALAADARADAAAYAARADDALAPRIWDDYRRLLRLSPAATG